MGGNDLLTATAAIESFENAKRLSVDAGLLLEQNRFPSAAGLSIIGLEELGKFIVFLLISTQRFPATRRCFKNHIFKQVMFYLGSHISEMVTGYLSELSSLSDYQWVSDYEWGMEFLSSINEDVTVKMIVNSLDNIGELRAVCENILGVDGDREDDQDYEKEEMPDKIKQKAFYVDIQDSNEISVPINEVTCYQATSFYDELTFALQELERLKRVMQNQEEWEKMRNFLRQSRDC